MAYRAEIEIGVKGAAQLKELQDRITRLSRAVDDANLKTLINRNAVQNINSYSEAVTKATRNLRETAIQLDAAGKASGDYAQAISQVVTALGQESAAQKIQNDLIRDEIELRRKAKLNAAGIKESTQYGGQIGPGAASPVALRSQLRGRLQQLLDEREKATFLAGAQQYNFPTGPNPRTRRFRFENDVSPERAEAALRARELEKQRAQNQQLFQDEKKQLIELDRIRAESAAKQTARLQALGKTIRGSLSSAAIGGAFPLLFGQSPQAAVGGAIGGLLGGQAGGFAGSLIGTALGEIAAAKERVKELTVELGFSQEQGKELALAFELAGRNSEQLQSAIANLQGVGLSVEETASAIKIANELAKEYGGKVDKIAQAFADTFESGKVSISTLNKFTAQGIPIQEKLADKLGINRSQLLELAKDGKISVQQVTDVMVELGRQAENTTDKAKTGFDQFTEAVKRIATAISSAAGAILKNLVPALDVVLTRLAGIIERATTALSLIADAQVGEASAALFRSGQARGMFGGFAQSKGTIDDLTKGLRSLNPAIASNREQLDKIAGTAQRYRTELQKFGGEVGKYSEKTAQVELSRVQSQIAQRSAQLSKTPTRAAITAITAPAQLAPAGTGGGGKKKTGLDDAAKEAERIAEQIRGTKANTEFLAIQEQIQQRIFAAEQARNPTLVARLQGEQKLLEIQFDYAQKLAETKDVNVQQAIINEGIQKQQNTLMETSRTLAQIEVDRKTSLEEKLVSLEREAQLNTVANEYARELLQIEFDILDLKKKGLIVGEEEADQYRTRAKATKQTAGQKIYQNMQQELTQLIELEQFAAFGAKNIGDAFGQSFQQVLTGSASAQEALAGMMQSIGENFINMATQIIAQQITMMIYGTILKALGIGFSSGGGGFSGAFGSAGPTFKPEAFSMPSLMAEGGFVTGPTNAIVGEGGEPEYVIPASKMSAAMARYSAGARGNSVIPDNGDAGAASTGGSVATNAVIDVRYTVERINNIDYVTTEQFQLGMQRAAAEGAARGEQQTLRRLQHSTSTRRKLGV